MTTTSPVILRGITWGHSRGLVPVVATAQRFAELNPGVEITWEKRGLQAFADQPIDVLAQYYDLLVIDHPWMGYAAQEQILLPLQEFLPEEFLADQAAHSVGKSHTSYHFDGDQYALAIDAATPVASYRPDLLNRDGLSLPQTWHDLVALAEKGKVIFPGIPLDSLMNFFMICSTLGEDPFVEETWAVSDAIALEALDRLRRLVQCCSPQMLKFNPIAVYEQLSSSNEYLYCPFAYGYSNYARLGYSANRLKFTDMVRMDRDGSRCTTTLGGTGLAISVNCQHRDLAARYAMFTASIAVQRTLYVDNGGQPGHRTAWLDDHTNALTDDYFTQTLPALDRAYLRPRYSGYLHFQDQAGAYVHNCITGKADSRDVLNQLKRLYRESKENIA